MLKDSQTVMTKTAKATATRDLQELVSSDIFAVKVTAEVPIMCANN